jgi:hypothetical protein
MRKLALAGLGVAVALAMPATALGQTQQNTYNVDATVTPKAKGSKKKPAPAGVTFGFQVSEANGLQPGAVKRYTIGFGGLKTNGKRFKTCTVNAVIAGGSDAVCNKKALIGEGTIDNYVYKTEDPSGAGGFDCFKDLRIYNAGQNKAFLYVGGDASRCGGVGDLAPIPAKFVKHGNGQALQFEVPDNVLHPGTPALTVTIRSVQSVIKLQTVKVKGKKVGFFESVAKKHPVTATFVTEQGQSATANATAR